MDTAAHATLRSSSLLCDYALRSATHIREPATQGEPKSLRSTSHGSFYLCRISWMCFWSLFPIGINMVLALAAAPLLAAESDRQELKYAPAAVDNPLKGLVPYAGDHRDRFPHSMEFNYLPLSSLIVSDGRYNWQALEDLLNAIAGRGHQAVFRVFLEYPGKTDCIPAYLIKAGLKVHKYTNTNTQPFPPQEVETPDYNNPLLRKCLKDFIAALGAKYDGDPRIGFITAGLLGTWGEWHTYPRNDLWASKAVQAEVMDAYQAAFKKTHILLRYPAAEGDGSYVTTAGRPFGYHDDSFAWATLDTGRRGDEWFFMAKMNKGGPALVDTWKQFPIGGEIRPEAWGIVFDEKPGIKEVQDFAACVQATHASWLMDTGMFREKPPEARRLRAEIQVHRMGYEFFIKAVTVKRKNRSLFVTVEVENRGTAPFYYDWPVEYALLAKDGKVKKTWPGNGKLTGLLPGDPARTWEETLDLQGTARGTHILAVRGVNPLANGKPVRFANTTQDQTVPGWLTLTSVVLP